MCNIGKKNYRNGKITTVFFLKNFVSDYIPMHIDIASVDMHMPDRTYYRLTGATGFGVKLLAEYLCKIN